MSLLTAAELREIVPSELSDIALDGVIAREEAEMVRRFGPHYTGASISERTVGDGKDIFVSRPIQSVAEIKVYHYLGSTTPTTLETTDYHVWAGQGRIQRLPSTRLTILSSNIRESYGSSWGEAVDITYIPQDDTQIRIRALIDLCRLALQRTGLKHENIANEYQYLSDNDWDRQRGLIYRNLGFYNIP